MNAIKQLLGDYWGEWSWTRVFSLLCFMAGCGASWFGQSTTAITLFTISGSAVAGAKVENITAILREKSEFDIGSAKKIVEELLREKS